MITESDISACSRRVARQDIAKHPKIFRSADRARAERTIVRHALTGIEQGKRGMRLRWHVLRASRVECGLSIRLG